MIYLRAIEPEDLELLYTIENNPELWAVSNNEAPYSRYTLKQYIASQPTPISENYSLRLIACLNDSRTAIGIVDLFNYSPIHQRAEVGIALLQTEQHKGYGKLILEAIETIAVKRLNLRLLYAYTEANHNAAGRKLFVSANYTEVGTIKAWHFNGQEYSDASFFQKILQKKD